MPAPALTRTRTELAAERYGERMARAHQARAAWTRSATARHLDELSAPLLALLRRRPGRWPHEVHQIGHWLYEHRRDLFVRAHARLAAAPDDAARATLLPTDLL
jgi:hypothetical protein